MLDWGDVPTAVAALVALAAAWYAGKQSREAKKARLATEAGVEEARRSAAASEAQADIAKESLALTRDELQRNRVDRDTPHFVIKPLERFMGNKLVVLACEMTQGVDLTNVTFSVEGAHVAGVRGSLDSQSRGSWAVGRDHFSWGMTTDLYVDMSEKVQSTRLIVMVRGEDSTSRSWELQPITIELTHDTLRRQGSVMGR